METQIKKTTVFNDKTKLISNFESTNEAAIHKLNDDCLMKIFMLLQMKDRIRIERVCKRWEIISKESWRNIKILNCDNQIWGYNIRRNGKSKTKKALKTIIFQKVLERCGHFLTRVDFTGMNIKDDILFIIAKLCPNIQSINFGFLNLKWVTIKAMASKCHNITEISCNSQSNKCKDNQLARLFSQNKNLRYLKMVNNEAITGKCLFSLPKDSIETLILNHCANLSPLHISSAVKNFDKLHTLSLSENYFGRNNSDSMIKVLPKSLKVLEIVNYLYIDMNIITTLTGLEKLDITNTMATDPFLILLAENCKELSSLTLDDCYDPTDIGLKAITRLPKLEVLSLKRMSKITDEALKYMPKLKYLECEQCINVKDDGICALIASCETLEMLNLANCRSITNDLVKRAVAATKLRTNCVSLEINLTGTLVDTEQPSEMSPYLTLILPEEFDSSEFSDSNDEYVNDYYLQEHFGYNPYYGFDVDEEFLYGYRYNYDFDQ